MDIIKLCFLEGNMIQTIKFNIINKCRKKEDLVSKYLLKSIFEAMIILVKT